MGSYKFHSRIVMPNSQSSSEKAFNVRSAAGINSITSSVLTLSAAHNFENSESVRTLSDNGDLTDLSQTEFTMSSPTPTQVVVSTNVDIKHNSSSEAEAGTGISINALGGVLKIASRVSDKNLVMLVPNSV